MVSVTYCFRHRFRLGSRIRIHIAEHEIALTDPSGDGENVRLRARDNDVLLEDAADVVIVGSPYLSETDAQRAGARWRLVVQKAFAAVNMGADFGDQAAPGGGLTAFGRRHLEEQHGGRILNDDFGLMVFACLPRPVFASLTGSG